MTESLASITPIRSRFRNDPLSEFVITMGKHRIAQLRAEFPFLAHVPVVKRALPPPCSEPMHGYCACHGPHLNTEVRHTACPCDECVRHRGAQ